MAFSIECDHLIRKTNRLEIKGRALMKAEAAAIFNETCFEIRGGAKMFGIGCFSCLNT